VKKRDQKRHKLGLVEELGAELETNAEVGVRQLSEGILRRIFVVARRRVHGLVLVLLARDDAVRVCWRVCRADGMGRSRRNRREADGKGDES
jgi:hypothetical protein